MSPRGRRLGALALLLTVGMVLALASQRRLVRSGRVEQSCALVDAGDPDGALAVSEGLVESLDPDDSLLEVATRCRCAALVGSDRLGDCAALVWDTVDRAGVAWLDSPELVALAAGGLSTAKRDVDAISLVERTEVRFAPDARLLEVELDARTRTEKPESVAAAIGPKILALPASESTRLRVSLARYLSFSGDPDAALVALGPAPVPPDPLVEAWYMSKLAVLAPAGRQLDITKTLREWESAGADPRTLFVRYAVLSSAHHLADAERSTLDLLESAVDQAPPDIDPRLLATAYVRLVMTYANLGRVADALATFDVAVQRGLPLDPSTRDEIARASDSAQDAAGGGRLELTFTRLEHGDRLLVSPAADQAVDAPYRSVALPADGRVVLSRDASMHPIRWVLLDAVGGAQSSGSAVLAGGNIVRQDVTRRGASVPPSTFEPTLDEADGRRRVYVVIVDCGDWRVFRYLQARGELPVFSEVERRGVAGVLTSEPPFTGIAMEKIAHPTVQGGVSFLGYVYHLGVELEGLESVGRNPVEALSWVLPSSPFLVDLVGAADRRALNLLFSHGDIEAGRNAEIVGPNSSREVIDLSRRRELTDEELAALPGLAVLDGSAAAFLGEMAAEFDAVVAQAHDGQVDLMLLRVEQTDLMTHGTFASINGSSVDGGQAPLFTAYRYIDRRVGELWSELDEDDVLIVMSDHGIETSLQHSPNAVFAMAGGGGAGRLAGRPELAGLPRLLTALVGVPPDPRWPDTGLEASLRPGGH